MKTNKTSFLKSFRKNAGLTAVETVTALMASVILGTATVDVATDLVVEADSVVQQANERASILDEVARENGYRPVSTNASIITYRRTTE